MLSEHILALCDELGVTTDVFSIGSSSRELAKNLISVIKDREPAEFGKKASLILFDRTLVSNISFVLSHFGGIIAILPSELLGYDNGSESHGR